ncbi:hypothetical protein [Nonomuraea montanisoli]|nr:hypothetical protein [Nonomuraea montanisoli]
MTDVYTVSIDAVDGATFRGRVHIVSPDVVSVSHEAHHFAP